MEALLHYVWLHRLYTPPLLTTDGEAVDVLYAGRANPNAGPDFLGARLLIGSVEWAGDVEIHCRSSHWLTHGHDRDKAYNGVVLHIVGEADAEVCDSTGRQLRQAVLHIPDGVGECYARQKADGGQRPCQLFAAKQSPILTRAWLTALGAQRLGRKASDIRGRVEACHGSWEQAAFATLARSYGLGVNSDVFEQWALSLLLEATAKHRDNLLHVEALFLGIAGLLCPEALPKSHKGDVLNDDYYQSLTREWDYARRVHGLTAMDPHQWRFLRLRPQNFPHIRIAQLSALYHSRHFSLAALAAAEDIDKIRRCLTAPASDYWTTHYHFGPAGRPHCPEPARATAENMLINAAIPLLYAWATYKQKPIEVQRAQDLLDDLPAENNHITREWRACGIDVKTAADSQALVQLDREYCERQDCLHCRFAYEMNKSKSREIKNLGKLKIKK